MPTASPWYITSSTVPVTAYSPAPVGAVRLPSYVSTTSSPAGSVVAVASRGVPSYVCVRFVSVSPATAFVTSNSFVTSGAASQFPFPAWLATIPTRPSPVNVRFVPPAIEPGPLATANVTAFPDPPPVACNPTRFVVSWSPIAPNTIAWLALFTVSVTTVSCGLFVASADTTALVTT